MTAPNIVVLAGSVRTGSVNEKLAAAAAAALSRAGAQVTHVTLRDFPLPIYDGDLQAHEGVPEPAKRLVGLFFEHQGAFVASPEYNASFSPLLKNTFDWMSRINVEGRPQLPAFKNRVFALGAAANGAMGGYRGLGQLRQMMELGLGALVLPDMVAIANAGAAFAPDGGLANDKQKDLLDAVARKLVDAARRFA